MRGCQGVDDDGGAVVGGGVGDGAVAVAVADDTVIDGTAADTSTMKKQNFHTGLDPVSRTKNSAKPTEFNAAVAGTVDKVRCAQLFSLDTGSSPVWSVVVNAGATDNDRAAVVDTVAVVGGGGGDGAVATGDTGDTVTNPGDETIVNGGTAQPAASSVVTVTDGGGDGRANDGDADGDA